MEFERGGFDDFDLFESCEEYYDVSEEHDAEEDEIEYELFGSVDQDVDIYLWGRC